MGHGLAQGSTFLGEDLENEWTHPCPVPSLMCAVFTHSDVIS